MVRPHVRTQCHPGFSGRRPGRRHLIPPPESVGTDGREAPALPGVAPEVPGTFPRSLTSLSMSELRTGAVMALVGGKSLCDFQVRSGGGVASAWLSRCFLLGSGTMLGEARGMQRPVRLGWTVTASPAFSHPGCVPDSRVRGPSRTWPPRLAGETPTPSPF